MSFTQPSQVIGTEKVVYEAVSAGDFSFSHIQKTDLEGFDHDEREKQAVLLDIV